MRERGQSLKLKSPADQTLTVKGLQVRMHTASGLLSLALLPPLLPNMHLAAKPFTFFFFMTTWPTFLALPSIPPPPPKCLLIVVNQQSIQHDTGHALPVPVNVRCEVHLQSCVTRAASLHQRLIGNCSPPSCHRLWGW
jgi:hypothetical protein